MFQIRNLDGSVVPLPKGAFVELVNAQDGSIGAVWYELRPGHAVQLAPGSADARRYEQMFPGLGVKFGSVITIPDA